MQKQNDLNTRIEITLKNLSLLISPVKEIINGIRTNTIPWVFCTVWAVIAMLILIFKIDHYVISNSKFNFLYPYYFYHFYAFSFVTLGYWGWAWNEIRKNRDRLKQLTEAFKNAGLQSKLGRLPQLISDHSIDSMTRKLRITNAGFPIKSFLEQTKYVESQLGIYIDEIKEGRETRSVDIIYSHYPMANEVIYSNDECKHSFEFSVGQTRAHHIKTNLRETPHLLVAGLTGGGKSTFLRQLIVGLATRNKQTKFLLIDLKGGLEFSLFENRSQFKVVPHVKAAVQEFQKIDKMLDERMNFLKQNQCKDIDAYFKKEGKPARAINLNRHIVVVDEAAEMFLAGQHAKSNDIQAARAIISRIARLGRAVGVNLVVATQRPDSRALDPQVKANLTGVVCFQMMNDASSIAVLGNGRATDLPKVPGRAIWKNGIDMIEVQTPFLSVEKAEELLGEPDVKEPKPVLEKNQTEDLQVDDDELSPDVTF